MNIDGQSKFDADLPDGVYLNLDEGAYFRQRAMGSSDWTSLHFKKHGWWWQSPHNPDYRRPEAKVLTYGSALHAIMLEGLDAYEARFIVQPDPAEFDGLLTTTEDMQRALSDAGFNLSGSSKWKKPDWAAAMRVNMPDVPVWLNIMERFDATKGDRQAITAIEDRQLRFMRSFALDDDTPDNADIRQIFSADSGYPALAEVSIFATVEGVRRRWRIDRMFPTFDLDLKSLGKWSGRPLTYETGEVMARRGWDIQRADYHDGRTKAYELIRAGRIYGGSIEQRKWLETWPDQFPKWDWVWLVYQKPDTSAGNAPVLFPIWDDSEDINTASGMSVVRENGAHKLAKAKAFYRQQVERFGLDRPWALISPLHHTDENRKPHIVLPHYIAEDAPPSSAAYDND